MKMQIGECAGQTKIAPEGAIFLIPKGNFGGAIQSRTGLDGFAIRCIGFYPCTNNKEIKKLACVCDCGLSLFFDLKRTEKGQDNLTLGRNVFAHCKQLSL